MPSKSKGSAKAIAPATPAAVKAAPTALKAPRILPPGTMQTNVGPKGGKMVEATADKHAVTEDQRQGERRASNTIQQFTDQMLQTPAAHPTPEQLARAEFEAKLAELAAQYGQALPTQAKAPRASNKVTANDITRPASGTLTGDVWDAADDISRKQGGTAAQISQVRTHPKVAGHNDATIKTQFARWRKFHGITGRAILVKATALPEGQYDGLPTAG